MAKAAVAASNKSKPVQVKNSKPGQVKKPPSSSLHPPYFQMIFEAISSLKDRTGSSQPAIAKFIEEKYQASLPPNFKKILSVQLKKFIKSEKLVKVKNSYKISASDKSKKVALDTKEKKEVKRGVAEKEKNGKKTKRLSQVSTPSALKKKKKVLTPKKVPKSVKSPKPAPKRAKKA